MTLVSNLFIFICIIADGEEVRVLLQRKAKLLPKKRSLVRVRRGGKHIRVILIDHYSLLFTYSHNSLLLLIAILAIKLCIYYISFFFLIDET